MFKKYLLILLSLAEGRGLGEGGKANPQCPMPAAVTR